MGPASRPTGPARRFGVKGVAIVAVMIVAALVATGCGSNADAPKASVTHGNGTGAEVASLLAGIPQRGNTLGDPKAPVTVEYFGDLECPFCRKFTLDELPSLIHSYVRSGKLKIQYRSLETATHDPETFGVQQVAALAAGQQDKLWNFIELFYHEEGKEDSGYVTEGYLQDLAMQVPGLNLIAWTAARSDAELARTLTRDAQAAKLARFSSTPTFLILNTHNAPYAPAITKLLRS
jgi:protein-disulfide isomerase